MKDTKTINFLGVSLLSLLMLVYTTVLQFSIPSVVLCFGDDGHIAFEQSDANFNCVDINEDSNLPVSNTPDLIGQSDDCQDIPLLNVLSTLYLEKDTKIKIKIHESAIYKNILSRYEIIAHVSSYYLKMPKPILRPKKNIQLYCQEI